MRHQTPSPSLPLELIIIIIDILHKDKATLKQCSRVSPQLLDHCRRYIFARIRLTDNIPGRTFEDFATFVVSTQAVAHHITHLHIAGSDEGMAERPPTFLRTATLSTILHSLPNLYALSMTSIELQQGHLSPHPLPPLDVPRTLFIDNFIFETDFPNFFKFLASFPALEELNLREMSWIPNDLPSLIGPEARAPALCALKRLTLGGTLWMDMDMLSEVISWSYLKISSTSITSLDLIYLSSEHASYTGALVSAAVNLERLVLRLNPHFVRSRRSNNFV